MIVLDVFATFAENKLRSAKQEQAPFALTCNIFSRKEQTLDNHYI